MAVIRPTGKMHYPEAEDLFFSTTDAKGIIEQANEVFVRIARHPRGRMIGAPHNLIRHPGMPGGAFKVMWDMIEAGEPMCAYALNLAGDGSAYWAFATITPMDDGGYLSVRTRPARTDLRDAAYALYQTVRPMELARRAEGLSVAQVAVEGVGYILAELQKLGFEDYRAFMRAVLPAEVQARKALGVRIPTRPRARGAVREVLDDVLLIDGELVHLSDELAASQDSAEQVSSAVAGVDVHLRELDEAFSGAREIALGLAAEAPILSHSAPGLHVQAQRLDAQLRVLVEHVDSLIAARGDLRFTAALAELQTGAAGQFAAAVIDGKEDPTSCNHGVLALTGVLGNVVHDLNNHITADVAASRALEHELHNAEVLVEVTSELFTNWRGLIERYGVTDRFGDTLVDLDTALAMVLQALGRIGTAVSVFARTTVGFDVQAVDRWLEALECAAGHLRDGVDEEVPLDLADEAPDPLRFHAPIADLRHSSLH